MTINRLVAASATILLASCYGAGAAAQVQPIPNRPITQPSSPIVAPPAQDPTVVQTPTRPVTIPLDRLKKPVSPAELLARPPLDITRWGIVERQGSQTHGKTGETLYVEGRNLDPARLAVEVSIGTRSTRLSRKPGGSSSRVEFVIPPQAITGELTASLQAVDLSRFELSKSFGICDRPRISRVSSPLLYRRQDLVGSEYLMSGKILLLEGECLDELQIKFVRSDMAGEVYAGRDVLLVKHVRSQSYAKAELVLHSLRRGESVSNPRTQAPLRLITPATGPSLVIDEAEHAAREAGPPPPGSLVPITIESVESDTEWGPRPVPFVLFTPRASGATANIQNPNFYVYGQIKVIGQNLVANPGTTWFMGAVPLPAPDVNRKIQVPSNAVSGRVCAVRRDGVRTCAPTVTTVVATPRLNTVPAGWPLFGTWNQPSMAPAGIRRNLTITGFDLKPPPGLGIEAALDITNFDRETAVKCDLDLKVHRFDAGTLTFSFGTPGGTRPDTCTEREEANMNILRPGGMAELKLKWVYEGDQATAKFTQWRITGVR